MRKMITPKRLCVAAAASVAAALVEYLIAQSGGAPFPPFGDPAKAQFYKVVDDPQSGAGAYVQQQNLAQVSYLMPVVLLGSSGIASAAVALDTGSGTYAVSCVLNAVGGSAVNQFIAANGSAAPLALVWNNQVISVLAASHFDTVGGQTVVATGQAPGDAAAIAAALTAP